MQFHMLKSKIHCVTVTEANLHYVGSITIDAALMEKAHILPNERVQITDNNNGARLETYVIPGPPHSGVICLNGAAARCVQPGDVVIIMCYAWMQEEEAVTYTPTVVLVDGQNKIKEVRHLEEHGHIE